MKKGREAKTERYKTSPGTTKNHIPQFGSCHFPREKALLEGFSNTQVLMEPNSFTVQGGLRVKSNKSPETPNCLLVQNGGRTEPGCVFLIFEFFIIS